jgi:hypothetical protein
VVKSSFRLFVLARLALAAICLCSTQALVHAQTVGGTILGVIRDQQGNAVSRTTVSARNLETGVIRETTSDDGGSYRISSIPAGSYEVTAVAAGFKTEVQSPVVVTVGGDVSVNLSLTVGAVTEKIEVTAEVPQVDTSSSTLAGFVNSVTIGELPLNGRDWLQLALLQPGVSFNTGQVQDDSRHAMRGNGIAMSISGGRVTDNAFRIDGMIVNDYANAGPGSTLRVNMGVDAILEFSVLTDNYSAEYGRGSGGVVNAITKSGTNQIHGSAYDFIRNSVLDARNFFDGRNIPPFRRTQFGGSIGGPIKKDKTFFFSNYESLHELKSLSDSASTLSANVHNGILCANTACTQTTQVPINPKILPYLDLYPVPNGAVTGNTGIFAYGAPRHGLENYVIGKIDHYFSPTTTLFASYTFDNTQVTETDDFDLKLATSPSRRENGVVSLQHAFSANVINISRVGVSRTYTGANVDCCAKNSELANPAFGFNPGQNMGTFAIPGVTGIFGGIGTGLGASGIATFGYTAPQAYDDLSWTKGPHSLRIGFSFERIDDNMNNEGTPTGKWSFTSVQNFLAGIPSVYTSDLPGSDTVRGERNSVIGAYIQDDIRVRPNLTINLGVRYEMATVVSEVNGKIANLRSITNTAVTVGGPYYHNPTLKDFAPRLGYAWDPFKDGKTAVRGGFAIFDIVPLPYLFVQRMPRSAPFYLSGTLSNPPLSSFPDNILSLLTVTTLKVAHIEFNPSPSYKAQWNQNIQRQLTKTTTLTLGYVGSVGVHLPHTLEDTDQVPLSLVTWNGTNLVFPVPAKGQAIQKINPLFGAISSTEWSGHSSYNALRANLVQRPVKGLTYQIAFTWSKSIDNGSATFSNGLDSTNSVGAQYAFLPRIDRGVSDFDIPHNFVANFQYDVPIPSSWKAHALANNILGGWQMGGIYTIQSGSPFSLKMGVDEAFTGSSVSAGVNGAQRPNYVNAPGCSPDAVTSNINNYIMTQCFAFPAPGVLGNLGRNTLRMPTFHDLDFSMFKNQSFFGEKLKAQFRAEMFNVLNYTNIQAQTLTIFDGSGNLIPSVVNAQGATVNTSRQIQFGLKLNF